MILKANSSVYLINNLFLVSYTVISDSGNYYRGEKE